MWKFLAAMLLCGTAYAQPNPPVFQSGTVTPTHTACWTTTGVIQDCGPGTPVPIPFPLGTLPILSATAFGVKANGVTSDDVALQSAVNACALIGAELVLPPGQILLTGAATINLRNCALFGSGVGAGGTTQGSLGTTLLLTSTTSTPFICGSSWRLSGINLYWPNQTTGTTVYPPFITDDGSTICSHNTIDNVVVVNAYDFVKQGGAGYGDWKVYNITAWAVHDLFQLNNLGDSFAMAILRLTPGPWLTICGGGSPCQFSVRAALDAASLNNSFLHVTSGPAVTVSVTSLNAEAWRYAVLIDNGGSLSGSVIDGGWDGIGTLIDASSGGHYNSGNIFRGSNTICGHAIFNGGPDQGNTPCFNMGNASTLELDGFFVAAPRGNFAILSGGNFIMRNSSVNNVGSRKDGTDYYLVDVTGTASAVVKLQNNSFSGNVGDVHTHGIFTSTNVPLVMTLQGNNFINFNDEVDIQSASNEPTSIMNNVSQATTGSASVTIRGTNQVIYSGNTWNKPPTATMGTCGTSPSAHGGMSGFFTTGTGGVTSCAVTLPWVPYGLGAGACVAMVSGTTSVNGAPGGTPPTWTFRFSAATDGANVFYNCPGQQ